MTHDPSDGSGALLRVVAVGAAGAGALGIWALATFIRPVGALSPALASSSDFSRAVSAAAVAPPVVQPRLEPQWIWSSADAVGGDEATFRRTFDVPDANTRATVRFSCDNRAVVRMDGIEIATSGAWSQAMEASVALTPGAHELVVEATNEGGPAGLLVLAELRGADGSLRWLATDEAWEVVCAAEGGGEAGLPAAPAVVLGPYGMAPWGEVPGMYGPDVDRAVEAAPGYVVELVHAVAREHGSWVAMTADDRGRLITSDQYGGLYRVTPAGFGGAPGETVVEPIDVPVGQAHGLAWIDGDLYCVTNGTRTIEPASEPTAGAAQDSAGQDSAVGGEPDSEPAAPPVVLPQGLYRVRDSDGDDAFDAYELLRAIPGNGGEHGPHAIVPGPDGKLYLTVGNHIDLVDVERSTVPRVWEEDQLLPRMWDPRGHAVGKLAPGGWIARMDRDGAEWELFSMGYRNTYDIAFDAHGELFAYDADMEWDMGTPWYRATRLAHVVSGSDFGWRSGSGKWPAYAAESLPPVLDLGPGSPTGVVSGAGSRFAPRHQHALFLLDWTFGTIHAVTLEPDGSTYRATRETFVSGRPFPVADAVITPADGAMYIVLGGRRVPSAVYRVRADTASAPAPAPTRSPAVDAAVATRRGLEAEHRPEAPASAVDAAWPALASGDPFIRHAARVVLEHQPLDRWLDRGLEDADAMRRIQVVIAAARSGSAGLAPYLVRALAGIDFAALDADQRLAWLRALQLTIMRQVDEGVPPATVEDHLAGAWAAEVGHDLGDALAAHFPSGDDRVDRELASVLVRLGEPSVVATALALMERAGSTPPAADEALLGRNDSYGRVIMEMASNPPQLQPIHYATVLRVAQRGWSPPLRERYFRWFDTARRAAGGHSYSGFLDRIRAEALERVPEPERTRLAALAADPLDRELAPTPLGPGRPWTTDAVTSVVSGGLERRDFEHGRRMFEAAACNVCHRFAAGGGDGGPDLTAVATRFSTRDLAEALVEPSREVSDQYLFEEFELDDGTTIVGRVVDDREGTLSVVQSLLAAEFTTPVPRARVVERRPSPVSPMPAGLLDRLNANEVRDLIAYVLSEGDARSGMFSPSDEEGFTRIFDGRTLAGWQGDSSHWTVEDGTIVGRLTEDRPLARNIFLVWTDGLVGDFELRAEIRVDGPNNSGLQYRSVQREDGGVQGYQCDIHPEPAYHGMLYEEGGRGIVATHGRRLRIAPDGMTVPTAPDREPEAIEAGAWHEYTIVATGARLEHRVDGRVTMVVEDFDREKARRSGVIGLQLHRGPAYEVRMREVRLKRQ